jgi:hypothetical protein
MGVWKMCDILKNGYCDSDFNCKYFKVETIPSGIKCFYEDNELNAQEFCIEAFKYCFIKRFEKN